jgi:hypothetical protein
MKMEKTLKKGLFVAASAVLMGMTLFAGEIKTYPKDGKGDQVLGYKNLANSYGISTSFEGNTVYVNRGGAPLERVFGAVEGENQKAEVMKNNKVIINGGVLATNGVWEKDKSIRGGSAYGAAGQSAVVSDNEVIIRGNSNVQGNIYGGYSHRGSVVNNKVIIEGTPKFGAGTVLFGGRGSRNVSLKDGKAAPFDVVTGNTLEVKTKNVVVKDVKNFEKLVFNVAVNQVKSNDKLLVLTNTEGVELQKPEIVKVSGKAQISDEEKEQILKEKNKDINVNIDVVLQGKPSKNIKNLKVVLVNAEGGLKLDKLPEDISRTEKGYKYEVKFQQDAKNLYAVINAQLVK